MSRRNRFAMLVAEFLGTGVLTLAVLSVQRSQLGLAYFVAIAAGVAVALMTYVFGNSSGGHFNPALTFGLMTARRVRLVPGVLYILVQLLGAWAAYALYHYFVHTDVQAVVQAFQGRILVAEAIGTMVFAMAWASASYNRYENGRFAVLAGLGFMIAVVVASTASIGVANPALALGVRAWEVFGQNGWLNYVVGPLLGAVIGVNLYGLLFAEADRPFALLRSNRGREASVVTVSESALLDEDEADLSSEDEAPVEKKKPAHASSSRATTTRKAATPKGATAASRAKKTTTKKVTKRAK